MRSPIIWLGNKERLLPEIVRRLPDNKPISRYVEPFVGSASVYLHLVTEGLIKAENSYLADYNQSLICGLMALQKNPDVTLQLLNDHERQHSLEYYNWLRSQTYFSLVESAAQFFYLCRASYSGIYRVNQKGNFNVPARKGKFQWCNRTLLWGLHGYLQNVRLSFCDSESYLNRFDDLGESDFIYCDPPYHSIIENGHRGLYTKFPFTLDKQERLLEQLSKLDSSGVKWMICNSYSSITEALYEKWHCELVNINYTVKGSQQIKEIIVTNY